MPRDTLPRIYVALPVQNELEYLPATLECIEKQEYPDFEAVVCVNQPDNWWSDPSKIKICRNNIATLDYLRNKTSIPLTVIDRATEKQGWKGKHYGVGWARKVVMDRASTKAKDSDIIVSLDADTTFPDSYFSALQSALDNAKNAAALSVPYYHKLTGDDQIDRLILRYEIYMRYYAINMWRIANPYCFSALGSAIALPVSTYKTIGGITPHLSGEDFYFLQKIRKYRDIVHWTDVPVYPAARFSNRVFFGTGPALIKGKEGDWKSYPIYKYSDFDDVKTTYDAFPGLFSSDGLTPMTSFLQTTFNTGDLWVPMRKNYRNVEQFVNACKNKIDGLRILQFLKEKNRTEKHSDEENLIEYLEEVHGEKLPGKMHHVLYELDFRRSEISDLNLIRDFLQNIENKFRLNHFRQKIA